MQIINELTLSKDLIKFPSITPVDAGAIKFLSKKLKSLGFNCTILEFKKGKGKKRARKERRAKANDGTGEKRKEKSARKVGGARTKTRS